MSRNPEPKDKVPWHIVVVTLVASLTPVVVALLGVAGMCLVGRAPVWQLANQLFGW